MNRPSTERIARAAIGIFAALLATSVSAHPGAHHAAASFSSGFVHPLFGWDHLLAMLAVAAAVERHPERVAVGRAEEDAPKTI